MNFETTSMLLDAIKPYVKNVTVEIATENKDWRGRNYKSDFVNVDAENHVGFEVFENEIIVFYFTDHSHFEDYFSELQNGEDNYIELAKSFLKELFEYKIRHIEYYKGKTLSSEKYFLMYNDGRDDERIGNAWYGLSKFINPFGKKSMHSTTWQFDKSKGIFTTRQPKRVDSNAIEVIDISDDCYIEIFSDHNVYTYAITEMDFDDYLGMYYWVPAINIWPTGLYDTKEKAIDAARETLECRARLK